jgi:hypothetical protein
MRICDFIGHIQVLAVYAGKFVVKIDDLRFENNLQGKMEWPSVDVTLRRDKVSRK